MSGDSEKRNEKVGVTRDVRPQAVAPSEVKSETVHHANARERDADIRAKAGLADGNACLACKAVKPVTTESKPLDARQQFRWGALGGCIIVFYRLWFYANKFPADAPWPHPSFKTCLLCGLWVALPLLSGLVSRACDPHHRLIAVFDGASAPALFIAMAKDFPL
jgi:hypothetical protein